MNQPSVKLTIRIPDGLHKLLQKRARERKRSLNTEVVESLRQNLSSEVRYHPESERERVVQMLRENGMISDVGDYVDGLIGDTPVLSHAELRKLLKGAPPLSEVIIQERDEGR